MKDGARGEHAKFEVGGWKFENPRLIDGTRGST
jgi:hypothetical protein